MAELRARPAPGCSRGRFSHRRRRPLTTSPPRTRTLGRVHALFDRSEYPDSIWRRLAGVARGRLSLLRGELDLAAAEFLGVVEDELAGPGTAEAQTALAEVLIYQREWSAAAEILQRVVDQAPADGPNGLTPHTLGEPPSEFAQPNRVQA